MSTESGRYVSFVHKWECEKCPLYKVLGCIEVYGKGDFQNCLWVSTVEWSLLAKQHFAICPNHIFYCKHYDNPFNIPSISSPKNRLLGLMLYTYRSKKFSGEVGSQTQQFFPILHKLEWEFGTMRLLAVNSVLVLLYLSVDLALHIFTSGGSLIFSSLYNTAALSRISPFFLTC